MMASFYAVSDDGRWLVLTPEERAGAAGRMSRSCSLGPLLGEGGRKLGGKDSSDAEAITRTAQGEWLIAFEREHRNSGATPPPIAAASGSVGSRHHVDRRGRNQWRDRDDGGWRPMAITCLACERMGRACADQLPADHARWRAKPSISPRPKASAEAGGVPTDAACKGDGTCFVLFRSYNASEGNRAADCRTRRRQYRQAPRRAGPAAHPRQFRRVGPARRGRTAVPLPPSRTTISAIATEMRAPDASARC